LVLRNLLTQRLLDFIAKTSRFFDARSRARAQMQTEDSSVDAGEEILAEKEDQSERNYAECQEASCEQFAVLQRGAQQVAIAFAKSLECILESPLESSENRLRSCRFVLMPAHDVQ